MPRLSFLVRCRLWARFNVNWKIIIATLQCRTVQSFIHWNVNLKLSLWSTGLNRSHDLLRIILQFPGAGTTFSKVSFLVKEDVGLLSGKQALINIINKLDWLIIIFIPIVGISWFYKAIIVAFVSWISLVHNNSVQLILMILLF